MDKMVRGILNRQKCPLPDIWRFKQKKNLQYLQFI